MAIGDVIRAVRRNNGLSQQEVATRSGLSRNTIARYERGAMKPSTVKLIELSRGLGCSINELLELDDPERDRATVYVVMYNDAVDSVWTEPADATGEKDRLHDPDKGRLVRVYPSRLNQRGRERS